VAVLLKAGRAGRRLSTQSTHVAERGSIHDGTSGGMESDGRYSARSARAGSARVAHEAGT
jgi:hypothetical protein